MRFFYLFAAFLTFTTPNFAQKIIKDKAPATNESTDVQTPAGEKNTETQDDYKLRRSDKELQLEFGASPFNPSNFAGPKEFDVYGRHLYMASFRVGRVVGTKKNVSYQYLFGATPFAIFTKNEVANPAYVSPVATPDVTLTIRENTFGFGIQPVNFRFIFLAKNRLKPYVQVGAGIAFYKQSYSRPAQQAF